MPKPLKWGILGASTRILSKDIHNYILCVVRILMKQMLDKFLFFSDPVIMVDFCQVHNSQTKDL